jgi:hypothetical protein
MVAQSGRQSGSISVGQTGWQYQAGLAFFVLLLFIYPVPHTISLRYLLLLGAIGLFGYLAIKHGDFSIFRRLGLATLLFVALCVWIVFGAVFISDDPRESLSEIRGQWLLTVVSLMTGTAAGIAAQVKPFIRLRLLQAIVLVFAIHVLIVDIQALWSVVMSGTFTLRAQGLTDGPDKASFLTNMFLAFLLSELFLRLTGKSRTFRINNGLFAGVLVLTLFSLYAEGTRNAVLALLVMCVGFIVLYWANHGRNQRPWWQIATVTCLLVVLLTSLFQVSASKRGITWDQMMDTIPVALDTKSHNNWLNTGKYGLPKLPDGRLVEESTYLRIAWLKEGLLLVAEHPLGIGFDRNAFGRGLQLKYGEGRGYSHSGIIDMAIGMGIPGVLLWITFLASLAWLGLRRFLHTGNYAGLTLLFVVLDFSTRLLLDSVTKDHMLQQFMLVAGLLAVMTVAPAPRDPSVASPR